MLRKLAPFLFFLLLGVAFTVLRPAYQTAYDSFYGVNKPVAVRLPDSTLIMAAAGDTAALATVQTAVAAQQAATGSKIEAAKASGGWVPSGAVGSKFIVFLAIYLLLVVWPWLVQSFTHPAPTRWQKTEYTAVFKELSIAEKLASVRAIQQNNVWRAIGAAVFAALVV